MNGMKLAEAIAVIDSYTPCIYTDNGVTDHHGTNIAMERMLRRRKEDIRKLNEYYWNNKQAISGDVDRYGFIPEIITHEI